jgi:hypothetical protein
MNRLIYNVIWEYNPPGFPNVTVFEFGNGQWGLKINQDIHISNFERINNLCRKTANLRS